MQMPKNKFDFLKVKNNSILIFVTAMRHQWPLKSIFRLDSKLLFLSLRMLFYTLDLKQMFHITEEIKINVFCWCDCLISILILVFFFFFLDNWLWHVATITRTKNIIVSLVNESNGAILNIFLLPFHSHATAATIIIISKQRKKGGQCKTLKYKMSKILKNKNVKNKIIHSLS